MDTPRKWQAASLATAVASMSLGAIMLSRPTSEQVAPINLDRTNEELSFSIASPSDVPEVDELPERRIVTPAAPVSPDSVSSPPSIASVEPAEQEPSPPARETAERDPSPPARETAEPTPVAPAAPTAPAVEESPDSPPSVESPPSAESPSSIDSDD